jgi:hypothetical protein
MSARDAKDARDVTLGRRPDATAAELAKTDDD